ncbi:hypothetical protein OH799_25345 [Nocardia sp. NBC_00881]|uniref:hypothetical protein n=1 Tax=Nocardia sp. NBC_00881 TaxID=2975995 RepID=UPI00386F9D86|nr:hypothetical protein OH799_25345 [Nocardia sp. NBC_00881]
MTRDNEPIGIRQSYIDGSLSIIGADGWPYSPEETAELFREAKYGNTLELLERVRDGLRVLARQADGAQ